MLPLSESNGCVFPQGPFFAVFLSQKPPHFPFCRLSLRLFSTSLWRLTHCFSPVFHPRISKFFLAFSPLVFSANSRLADLSSSCLFSGPISWVGIPPSAQLFFFLLSFSRSLFLPEFYLRIPLVGSLLLCMDTPLRFFPSPPPPPPAPFPFSNLYECWEVLCHLSPNRCAFQGAPFSFTILFHAFELLFLTPVKPRNQVLPPLISLLRYFLYEVFSLPCLGFWCPSRFQPFPQRSSSIRQTWIFLRACLYPQSVLPRFPIRRRTPPWAHRRCRLRWRTLHPQGFAFSLLASPPPLL